MLSPDKGHCYVFFATIGGVEEFNEKLNRLKLYKPSLRAALAKEINGRYTPDITFKFDAAQEKTNRVEELLRRFKTQRRFVIQAFTSFAVALFCASVAHILAAFLLSFRKNYVSFFASCCIGSFCTFVLFFYFFSCNQLS
jgi:hypothetical protein